MIKPKKLLWQIFPANVLTVLVAIIALSWYGASSFQLFYLADTESDLEARAHLIKSQVIDYVRGGAVSELRDYCIQAGRESGTRITVIAESGRVIADSNENPEVMDNHRHRPEIEKGFSGQTGVSRRYSKTLDENFIYVAIPVKDGNIDDSGSESGNINLVVRTSVSIASLDNAIAASKVRIGFGALAVVMLAAVVTLLISRNVSKPLAQMTESAEQFSRGDFGKKMLLVAKKTASLEVVTLAASMDRMAELLDEKIQVIVTHRNQLETVFSSMTEAVIAIDSEEQIISINDSAAKILGLEKKEAKGKLVQQIVRNVRLQQQITSVLTSGQSIEGEITLQDEQGERFLQTNVVTLHDGADGGVGVLVVMNDVTKLRRLEEVRRDFVANVSHELRTPITSIRGYVETLLDGALDIREDAVKFLGIVLRQSERLTTIIDDLLALSRIEEDSRQNDIVLEAGKLKRVIESAVQTCQIKADKAEVTMHYECAEDIVVVMNATLLEQAIINLLVNAVTYSRIGGTVLIKARTEYIGEKKNVKMSVSDQGCGISSIHLPRLFERFYRSDKARSRALGGTGLGLAIVKHIVQAHDGQINVTSVEGEGTIFTITLSATSSKF